LCFEGDGRVVRYPGNYETFRRLRAEARASEEPARAAPPSAPPRREKPGKKGLTMAEKRVLEGLPDASDALESTTAALELKHGDPSTYAAGGKEVSALQAELATRRSELERLMARWEELEGKR